MILFKKQLEKAVDERLKQLMEVESRDAIDRYAREALKNPILVQETSEVVTTPGGSVTLFTLNPRTPTIVGGYIDMYGAGQEDKFILHVDMQLRKDLKWRRYEDWEFTGTQLEPIKFLKDYFVVCGIRVILKHESGVGKKIYHTWYRRK